jgi:hypothetical protein
MPATIVFCTISNPPRPLSTDQQHVTIERQAPAEKRPTDDLVHGIVSANVFTQDEQFAGRGEKRRRMQSAGSAKDCLRIAQLRRQLAEHFGIEQCGSLGTAQPSPPKLSDRRFSAHPAGRSCGESTGRAICREAHVGIERHAHEISCGVGIAWHAQRN